MKRNFSFLMFVFSIIGGIGGFFLSEYFLASFQNRMPDVVIVGIYFGCIMFCVGVMCLIAEMISPRLNGKYWREGYFKSSWKVLVPCTLVLLFISGVIFQFIYQLDMGKNYKITNFIMLVDTSESMKRTDPKNDRFKAVEKLMKSFEADDKISIFTFNDDVQQITSLVNVDESTIQNVSEQLKNKETPKGGTNIEEALNRASDSINTTLGNNETSAVILLSDGGDNYGLVKDFDNVMKKFKGRYVPIYTVGMKGSDEKLLKNISYSTGGEHYSVDDAKKLNSAFKNIYLNKDRRLLIDRRNGVTEDSALYAFLRVIFITLIGVLFGIALGLVFDNKYLAKGFVIGGVVSGIIAGIVLEIGFSKTSIDGTFLRFIADIILASIFTLFSLAVNEHDNPSIYNKKGYSGVSDDNEVDVNRRGKRKSF